MNEHVRDLEPRSRDLFVDVPGGRLFVRVWGEGPLSQAPPIVLIHDSLGSVELWREFPSRLAEATGHHVVAYDRLGFGRSDPRSGGLDPLGFVRDEARTGLPALRAALTIDRMILFGHSVGGSMAIAAATELAGAAVGVITESAQVFAEERTMAGIRAAKSAFADPRQMQRLARYHGAKASWVLTAWTETWLAPAFASWTLDDDLRRMGCPILAIHGDRDEYASLAHPERIATLAPTPVEMVILHDCGHVPHREYPDAVLRAVRTFVGELSLM